MKFTFKSPYNYIFFEIYLPVIEKNNYYIPISWKDAENQEFTHKTNPKHQSVSVNPYIELINILKRWFESAEKYIQVSREFQSLVSGIASSTVANSYLLKPNPAVYIEEIKIKEFYSIKQIHLEDLSRFKEIYFLGENGDGKTLLLQAITIAGRWHQIVQKRNFSETGTVMELVGKAPQMQFYMKDSEGNTYQRNEQSDSSVSYITDLYAYGVNRRASQSSEHLDQDGFLSLFSESSVLQHPITWLKEIDRLEAKNMNRFLSLKTIKSLLSDLLGSDRDFQIETDKEEISFVERGTSLNYAQLSEGYKSVITWLIDLIFHLSKTQADVQRTQDFTGIVLVDEVNLHLHPKWEYELPKKLRNWFPKIQFIFTTHSPITILGASEDALFYKLYKQDGQTHLSEPMPASYFKDTILNGIATSPLFSLSSSFMQSASLEHLNHGQDYYDSRIRAMVKEQVDQMKASGKIHFSIQDIDEIIQNAIANTQQH
jgi:predicted ATPase